MPVPSKLNSAEHLMVLPVPMRVTDGGRTILFESQACNGLDRWCDSFESLYVAAPVLDESLVAGRKSMSWVDVKGIPSIDRIEFVGAIESQQRDGFLTGDANHPTRPRGLARHIFRDLPRD